MGCDPNFKHSSAYTSVTCSHCGECVECHRNHKCAEMEAIERLDEAYLLVAKDLNVDADKLRTLTEVGNVLLSDNNFITTRPVSEYA